MHENYRKGLLYLFRLCCKLLFFSREKKIKRKEKRQKENGGFWATSKHHRLVQQVKEILWKEVKLTDVVISLEGRGTWCINMFLKNIEIWTMSLSLLIWGV